MRTVVAATVLVVLAVLDASTLAAKLPEQASSPRQARWFLSRADVTEVVEEEKVVTQVTPWSCVVVAPSLPPCRHVRQINIAATPPTPIYVTQSPSLPHFYGDHNAVEARRRYYLDQGVGMGPVGSFDSFYSDMVPVPVPSEPHGGWVPLMARESTDPLPAAAAAPAAPVAAAPAPAPQPAAANVPANAAAAPPPAAPVPDKKREQGWAEWLGLRAHTVTSTLVRFATTRVVDPDTVVTFSVRGCQPSKLPFDLPMCVTPQSQQGHSTAEPTAPAVEVRPAGPVAQDAAAPAPVSAAHGVDTVKAGAKPADAVAPAPVADSKPVDAPPAEAEAAPAPAPAAPAATS